MALINISNLTFSYDGSSDYIFKDVSFQIDTDWKLGFCGRNGRGKTTFLKLLMGKYEYSGTISAGNMFDYFPPEVSDKTRLTLDVLQEISPLAELWQIQKELSKLAVDENALYRPFDTLSNGEQTKALLAGLFLNENNFLLIDEPTNHLDRASRQIAARYLKSKAGYILVSHDRCFLDECTDHTLSINKADIEIIAGNFSVWQEQNARQTAFEQAENNKLESEIGRLKKAAAQTANWSDTAEKTKYSTRNSGLRPDRGFIGHKAAKMMKRSKVIEKRQNDNIFEKSKLLKNIERADDLKIRPLDYHKERLLSLSGVNIHYAGREVFRDFNMVLEQGERVALAGGNGSGKSSIIKLICGRDITYTGKVEIGSRLIISYVPQDASFLAGNLRDFAKEQGLDETLFKNLLHKLDFSRVQFEKDMQDFSAGQKKKVLIAKSLCQSAHVYIWDEPLNYIDVLSRIQIENLLLDYQPTMIFVEHDKAFCDKVATRELQL